MAEAADIVVKTYKGTQEAATKEFQKDALTLASEGYFPTTQNYAPGAYGCGSFLFALLLCVVLIGVVVFIYMLLVKPPGVLSVTYQRQSTASEPIEQVAEKICPRCAERIKAAAKICRFCNYEFA